MKYYFLILVFAVPFICSAQNDSSVIYISKDGKLTTKDSAYIYSVKSKHDDLWHAATYFSSNNKLQSDGDFADEDLLKPVGKFDNYIEDGILNNTSNFKDGVITGKTYYYKNGNKKSFIAYGENGVTQQKGWDENGKAIAGYITEQEAKFGNEKGAWNKYLERNLNASVAADAGMAPGIYSVVVLFTVSKDGTVINVKIDADENHCKACMAEAIRVVVNSPAWQPAIQNNEPVIYRQKQKISFQVVENKKNKKN